VTISSETIRNDYIGNGSTDTFPFEFIIYDQDDIDVYVNGALQVVDIDYTIDSEDIDNPNGGSIVFGIESIPADGAGISIVSSLAYKQETSLNAKDKTYETTYDKAVVLIKQLRELLARSLSLAVSSRYAGLSLPDPEAGYYLRWKDDLSGLENAGSSGGSGDSIVEKTISSGVIAVSPGERIIKLIGEGGMDDSLYSIYGGVEGDEISLWRKTGDITVVASGNIYLQYDMDFIMNHKYDNITLVSKGTNVWVEKGGRINVG
jgi:hypothetical protein